MRSVRQIAGLSLLALSLTSGATFAGDDNAHYRAGLGLLERGQHAMALEELDAYVAQQPDGDDANAAHYARAICLLKLDRNKEAASELDHVIAVSDFTFRPDALLLRAQIAFRAGEFVPTIELLTRLEELPQAALFAALDQALAMRGEAMLRSGRSSDAVETFDVVIHRWPASSSRDRCELLAAHAMIALGKDASAIERLASLRTRVPDGPYVLPAALAEAQCQHRRGSFDAALPLYERASTTDDAGARADALIGVAQSARMLGKTDRARAALDALDVHDGHDGHDATNPLSPLVAATIRLERAQLALESRDAKAGLALLEQQGNDVPSALSERFAATKAACQTALGQHADAERTLAEATKDDANARPSLRLDRAVALFRIGKYAETVMAADAILTSQATPTIITDAALLRADALFAQDLFKAAAEAYDRFAQKHADHASLGHARVRAGLAYTRSGDVATGGRRLREALASLAETDRALRRAALSELLDQSVYASRWTDVERDAAALLATLDPTDADHRADAQLRFALAAARTGRTDEALARFETLLREQPRSVAALQAAFERGQILAGVGRADEARAAFDTVMRAAATDDPLHAASQRQLASLSLREGKNDAAAALLADADDDALIDLAAAHASRGRFADAEAALKRFIAGHPKDQRIDEARARLAIAIARQGRADDALVIFDGLIADGSTRATAIGDADLAVAVRYERAMALVALQRRDQATTQLKAILTEPSPYRPFAAIELARVASEASRHAEALTFATTARESLDEAREPDRPALRERVLYLLGASALRTGDSAAALTSLEELIRIAPKGTLADSAGLLLGEALLAAGRADDAAETLDRLVQSTARDDLLQPALLRLGEATAAAQRWSASDRAFSTFIERFASSDRWFLARFGQGWSREQAGQHDAAIACYRDVVARHDGPTAARAQFQIGECLFALKRYDEAAKELLKVDVLFTVPEWSAAALFEAGRCFVAMRKPEDARVQFAAVRTRFADTRWAELSREESDRLQPDALPGREQTKARATAQPD